MVELRRLVRRELIRHFDDVVRLRSILNARGFDASYNDIQTSYSDWSERTSAAGWLGLDSDDDVLFFALTTGLRFEDKP